MLVNYKLYGFVNVQVKKEVKDKIDEICKDNNMKISELLLTVLEDETLVTLTLKLKNGKKYPK